VHALSILKRYSSDFVNLFYPDLCVSCGRKLLFSESHFCSFCKHQMPRSGYINTRNNAAEKIFYGRIPVHSAASAYLFHNKGRIQKVLHAIKYKGQKDTAFVLGQLLGKELKKSDRFSCCDTIVPVPLHLKKLKIRGYNQSEWLGKGLSEGMEVPLNTSLISRNIYNNSQTTINKYDRWLNVENAFQLNQNASLNAKHILLVDDVLTSGATLEACGRELLKIPNSKLSLFTLAFAD
jgi:ComF family protein